MDCPATVHPRSVARSADLGFVRTISSLSVTLDCEEFVKNGFVRATCHPDRPQHDCHSGRIGFVRAISDANHSANYEGFMKNGFVFAISVGRNPEAFSTASAIMLVCICGADATRFGPRAT
jgi:hypothetical protein